jgi:hypothetical protein
MLAGTVLLATHSLQTTARLSHSSFARKNTEFYTPHAIAFARPTEILDWLLSRSKGVQLERSGRAARLEVHPALLDEVCTQYS